MTVNPNRTCAVCDVDDIPRGVDWPWWSKGRPVHSTCHPTIAALPLAELAVHAALEQRLRDGPPPDEPGGRDAGELQGDDDEHEA